MEKRLVYFDVLRGLSMFAVVYSHFLLFSLNLDSFSWIISFLRAFFLNAFFFTSGYMAYKQQDWNIRSTLAYLNKKVRSLLIPTFVCGSCFVLSHHVSMSEFLLEGSKCGYWFTFSLFCMFLLYAVLMFVTSGLKHEQGRFIILSLVALLSFVVSRTPYVNGTIQNVFSLPMTSAYLLWFFLGVISRRYETFFRERVLESRVVVLVLALFVFISYIVPVSTFLNSFCTTILVICLVKRLTENESTKANRLIHMFAFLGRNTLEIYFIHYFILYPLPPFVRDYLSYLQQEDFVSLSSCVSLPEFMIVGTNVLLVCYTCVVIARVLKQIPYLGLLLFGKKNLDASNR